MNVININDSFTWDVTIHDSAIKSQSVEGKYCLNLQGSSDLEGIYSEHASLHTQNVQVYILRTCKFTYSECANVCTENMQVYVHRTCKCISIFRSHRNKVNGRFCLYCLRNIKLNIVYNLTSYFCITSLILPYIDHWVSPVVTSKFQVFAFNSRLSHVSCQLRRSGLLCLMGVIMHDKGYELESCSLCSVL
jgi:hypothetical protein